MNVSDALATRITCRAFRFDPVPEETVRAIIDKARYAPSGGNLQPCYMDEEAPINGLHTDRANVDEIATFMK